MKPSQKSNFTPDESAALINIQKRDDTVIKPADKGGADGPVHIEQGRLRKYFTLVT